MAEVAKMVDQDFNLMECNLDNSKDKVLFKLKTLMMIHQVLSILMEEALLSSTTHQFSNPIPSQNRNSPLVVQSPPSLWVNLGK